MLIAERRSTLQRRSYISKTSLIGDSQIPSALGQTITGALANIPFPFGIDSNGNYGYRKDGADTVTPFKSGGSERTVLWTNPNPAAEFAAQTVQISDSISSYDYIDIEAKVYIGYTTGYRHVYYTVSDFKSINPANGTGVCASIYTSWNSGAMHTARWVGYVDDTHVRFGNGATVAVNDYNNTLAIPLSIAGIKGSLPSLVQASINTSMYNMRLPCLRSGHTLIDGVISQTGTTLPPCMPIAGFSKIKVRIGSSARPLYYVFTKPDGTQYGQSIGGRQAISSTSETTIDIPTGATIWWYILTVSTSNQDVDNIGLSLVV